MDQSDRTAGQQRRVLWFHARPLLPARSGGEIRVIGLIEAVLARGHEVLVVQPGPLGEPQPSAFNVLEVPTRRGPGLAVAKVFARSPLRSARISRGQRRAVRQVIADFDPDIAVVSELLSWPLASTLLPDVPWIFDAHNVEAQMYAEFARGATTVFDRVTFHIDSRRVARQEPVVVRSADAVVTVSADDAEALQALGSLRRAPVVVPSSVPTPPEPHGLSKDPVMLFVGTMNHPPNVEAVRELAGRILPRIRQALPAARLTVVGRKATSAVREVVARVDGVQLVEDAAQLGPYYQAARCTVMPIRAGGGSRLKVYEAFGHGLPVVGTSRAVAGIVLSEGLAVVTDSEDGLVEAALRVLTDDTFAADLSAASRDYFLSHLSWPHAAEPLLGLIEDLTRAGRSVQAERER